MNDLWLILLALMLCGALAGVVSVLVPPPPSSPRAMDPLQHPQARRGGAQGPTGLLARFTTKFRDTADLSTRFAEAMANPDFAELRAQLCALNADHTACSSREELEDLLDLATTATATAAPRITVGVCLYEANVRRRLLPGNSAQRFLLGLGDRG
jgi:hypothetical protein